jgi:heme/copper-type cytochrome/quinol oxidase subunit 2
MKALARAVAILTSAAVLLVGLAATATADSPSTWDEAESRSDLENLIFFGGSTIGLIVGISLFALVTARNNYVPPPPGTDVEVSDPH